jgi:hypothetical protein
VTIVSRTCGGRSAQTEERNAIASGNGLLSAEGDASTGWSATKCLRETPVCSPGTPSEDPSDCNS